MEKGGGGDGEGGGRGEGDWVMERMGRNECDEKIQWVGEGRV